MKRTAGKWASILSGIMLAVLVLPVAAETITVGPGGPGGGYDYETIQEAVAAAEAGDTILVAAGEYSGANIDREVAIVGVADGSSVITSGVPFSDGSSLTTGFRIFPGADGVEIRNFTVECDSSASFFFGVFGRGADGVTVDSLVVNGPVQGITNVGGSNWKITNNELNYTEASGGGGIGISVTTTPPDFPVASGNLIKGNTIIVAAEADDYSHPGILLALDLRWGKYDHLTGSEEMFGNQIVDNTITGNGGTWSMGVQIGVQGLDADPDKIAATIGIIDGTAVQGNTIADVSWGMYFYTVSNLAVESNVLEQIGHGIVVYDGNKDIAVNFNNFSGISGYSLFNGTDVPIDATRNYWGAEIPDFNSMIGGKADFFPYYADAELADLRYWSDDFVGGAQQTWTVVDGGDNSSALFQNDRFELYTESGSGAEKFLAAYVDAAAGDGVMQARVRRISEADDYLAYLLARVDPDTMSGYVCGVSSSGTHLWFGKLTGGGYAPIEFTGTVPAFDPADCQVRFAVYGGTLVAKVWTTGDPEPADWQITATDSSYTSGVSGVMLATYPTLGWNTVQVAFDYVSLSGIWKDAVWVDAGWAGSDAGKEVEPGKIYGYNAFATIQAAIDAAEPGATVHVAAGTYEEQLIVVDKELTIIGAGMDETFVLCPEEPVVSFVMSSGSAGMVYYNANMRAVVGVKDAKVTIQDLTVDGAERGMAGSDFTAITYYNSGGTIENVRSIRSRMPLISGGDNDGMVSGVQMGHGIGVFQSDNGARTVNIVDSEIEDFQKTGVLLGGADLIVNVSGSTVAGGGDQPVMAQNGIQYYNGATGSLIGNHVLSLGHNNPENTWSATHIMAGDCDSVLISGNTVTGTGTPGSRSFGIYLANRGFNSLREAEVTNNVIQNTERGIRVRDEQGSIPAGEFNLTIHENDFVGNRYQFEDPNEILDLQSILDGNGYDRAVVVRGSDIKVPVIFSSIQDAIDHEDTTAGDTVEVAPGTYTEQLTINKDGLTIRPAENTGEVTVRLPDSGLATLSAPAPGHNLSWIIRVHDAENVTIEGLTVDGGDGLPETVNGTSPVQLRGIWYEAASGTIEDNTIRNIRRSEPETAGNWFSHSTVIAVRDASDDTAIRGNTVLLHEHGREGISVIGVDEAATVTIEGNQVFGVGDAMVHDWMHSGIAVVDVAGDVDIIDNDLEDIRSDKGNSQGIYVQTAWVGISGDITITENRVTAADIGVYVWEPNHPDAGRISGDLTISGNTISGSSKDNVRFYLHKITGDVDVSDNTISGATECGVIVWDQGGVIVGALTFRHNSICGSGSWGLVNVSATVVDAAYNYWGDATGPYHASHNPSGEGDAVSDNVLFDPYYADAGLTQLAYLGGHEQLVDLTIEKGETLTVPGTLTVPAGVTVTVFGDLDVGEMDLEGGAVLVVVDGSLTLGTADGGKHTIAGTFTVYNSFGSVHFYHESEFIGDALMLISDIHVAPNVTLTVTGSLILDGCTVSRIGEEGTYTIKVVPGGELQLARTAMSHANLTLEGDGSLVRDNFLTDVAITVAEGATGNEVFHNVFLGTTALTNNGTGTVTEVDDWGNVGSLADTRNNLTVDSTVFVQRRVNGALVEVPGRTLDAYGNLFIQPGDVAMIDLDVAKLGIARPGEKIQMVEAMLGFHTGYFTAGGDSSLGAVAPWEYELHNAWSADGVYGKIDTAIGLSITHPDPEGTAGDGAVAQIALESHPDVEGVTRFYFRTWLPDGNPWMTGDNPMAGTRLAVFQGTPPAYHLTPFTMNTGYITIDGTDPEIARFTATQEQGGAPVDVFAVAAVTHQGTVVLTVDARDALAGIADDDVILTLTLRSNPAVTLDSMLVSAVEVEEGGETWTRYTFEVEIGPATLNGIYDVKVFAADRSGNVSEELKGEITVQKQVAVTVELQGAVAGPFDRAVTFVATDAVGGFLKEWTETLTFTGGTGEVTLLDAPEGMAFLSAKTDWTLRTRVSAVSVGGPAVADFTGANHLRGGDLNGDNQVDALDFAILRYYWYTGNDPADITGNGVTDATDYEVMRKNWYTTGHDE